MESFEKMGYWWLPEETNEPISEIPERAIPGKLSFDPATGGVLELLGNFEEGMPFGDNLGKSFSIIQGYAGSEYACITLNDCMVTGQSFGTVTETKLMVERIFRSPNYWFGKAEDIVIEKLFLSYTHFDDWMRQNNFRSDRTHHNYERVLTYDVGYVSPEPIEISLDNVKIRIESALSSKHSITEVSLKNFHRFIIIPQKPLQFDEYLPFVNFHLCNILTLATNHTNYPLNISGKVSDKWGVRIYYRVFDRQEKEKSVSPWSMLFTFDDVEDELSKYLSKWICSSERLRTVYALYFYVRDRKTLALQTSFLSLAQALEGYHRIVCGGAYLTPDEYKPVREALTGAIPSWVKASHRNKLKEMLRYGFQFSLRKRLEDICIKTLGNNDEIVSELIGKPKVFAREVTNMRNALTHPDVETEREEISPSELFNYVQKMEFLMRMCFLKEMEFPADEVKRLFRENQEYQYLIEKN